MLRFLPWCFLLFPALELWVLIRVGSRIGALNTIGLVFLSAVAGLFLLRLRGARIASRFQAELSAGRIPAAPILDTVGLVAAGWLFIFPGFVSDVIALLLLVPLTRQLLAALFLSRLKASGFAQSVRMQTMYTDSDGRMRWSGTTNNAQESEPGTFDVDPVQEKPRRQVIIDCAPEDPKDGNGPKHDG